MGGYIKIRTRNTDYHTMAIRKKKKTNQESTHCSTQTPPFTDVNTCDTSRATPVKNQGWNNNLIRKFVLTCKKFLYTIGIRLLNKENHRYLVFLCSYYTVNTKIMITNGKENKVTDFGKKGGGQKKYPVP